MFLVGRNESNPFSLSALGKLSVFCTNCVSVERVGAGHFSLAMSAARGFQGQECSYFCAQETILYVKYSRSAPQTVARLKEQKRDAVTTLETAPVICLTDVQIYPMHNLQEAHTPLLPLLDIVIIRDAVFQLINQLLVVIL